MKHAPRVLAFLRALLGGGAVPAFSAELAALIGHHALGPFAWAELGRRGEELSAAFVATLKNQHLASLAKHVLDRRALAEVLALLAAPPSIPVIGLEGLDYAERLYTHPAERPMSDHALLVPKRAFSEALARILRHGFHRTEPVSFVEAAPDHHEAQIHRGGYSVDLHHAFRQPIRAAVDYERLFAASVPGVFDSQPIAYLSHPHRLIAHCYHQAAHELSVPMIAFVDLELMLRQPPVIEAARAEARAWHVERPLAATLRLWADLRERTPEPWMRFSGERWLPSLEEIASTRRPSRLVQLARKAMLIDSPRHRVAFAMYAVSHLGKGSLGQI